MIDWLANNSAAAVILTIAMVGLVVKLIIWYADVNGDRKNFSQFMEKIDGSLEEIGTDLKKIFHKLPRPRVAEGQSPARLTDFGKEVSQTIMAEEWAKDVAPEIEGKIAGMPEHLVEAFCRKYVDTNTPEDDDRVLLGMYEHALGRDPVLSVLRIVLRDRAAEAPAERCG